MTLVEFLRARLDEDAEVAQQTRRFEQRVDGTERWFASHGNAITSMAPHRAVAEVDAKRRIIDEHNLVPADCPPPGAPTYGCEICHHHPEHGVSGSGECTTLRLLALPYADDPTYQDAWRV